MTRIHIISPSHPLYPQEVELRERVLLAPIGYDIEKFSTEFVPEDRFEHFIAVMDHPKGKRVIGCVCLLPNYPEPGIGKLMQMAVDPQRQREGIGRELVAHLERRALADLGLRELFCHSREDACPFYANLGWITEGERFLEAGIPHFKMVFRPS